MSKLQSVYRKFHSSETALLYVQNDILASLDAGHSTALLLLDLSATFDTIDHSILTHRLQHWFGTSSTALNLLSSFLSDRFQTVITPASKSNPVLLEYDVPQGSVLRPLLYFLYTTPLHSIISKYLGLRSHFYADDPQIYLSFSPELASSARIATRTSRSSHITPVLKSLHWLPVQYRINFKLFCITHRALS